MARACIANISLTLYLFNPDSAKAYNFQTRDPLYDTFPRGRELLRRKTRPVRRSRESFFSLDAYLTSMIQSRPLLTRRSPKRSEDFFAITSSREIPAPANSSASAEDEVTAR